MGFFDALRRVAGRPSRDPRARRPARSRPGSWGVDPDDLPIAEETPFDAGEYDRAQWAKKLKRVLDGLPATRPEWDDVAAEARAMGFDPAWVASAAATSSRCWSAGPSPTGVVTEAEHRKLDLARDLIGIPDAEAEAILHSVVAEAEIVLRRRRRGGLTGRPGRSVRCTVVRPARRRGRAWGRPSRSTQASVECPSASSRPSRRTS